jgi:hypothetical protein
MAGFNHLRHSGAHIKITEAFILITKLIDLLHIDRVADLRHNEQDQNLHIQHIVNKSKSAHILHLLYFIIQDLSKKSSTHR